MFVGKIVRRWKTFSVALIAVASVLITPMWHAYAQAEPLPDLTLDTQLGFTNEGKDEQGNCVGKLRITVKNKGNASAGSFVVGFTISQATYQVAVPNLQNGASTTVTPSVVIPVGTQLIRVLADAGGAVQESNEVNNSWAQHVTCAGAAR
jgi:subtilase family serine protease